MLKKTLLFLLSLTLILMLPSCDLMKGNKFIEWGLHKYQSPEVDALINDIDNGFTASKPSNGFYDSSSVTEDTVTVDITKINGFEKLFGFDTTQLKIDKDVADRISTQGLLKPDSTEDATKLNSKVYDAITGSANKDLLNESIRQPASETNSNLAYNSVAFVSSALEQSMDDIETALEDAEISSELTAAINTMIEDMQKKVDKEPTPENRLTKAEVLQVQLITNFVVSVSNVTNYSSESGEKLNIDSPEVKQLLDEALTLSMYSETIKGVDMIRVPSTDLITDIRNNSNGENTQEAGNV